MLQGFPFDDDSDDEGNTSSHRFRNRNRADRPTQSAKAFFAREPFAETKDVHEPPWGEERQPKKRVVEQPAPQPSLNQHGLRNTVPLAQAPKSERAARAMSAPPGDRTLPRFTTTCEIPVMGTVGSASKPPTNTQQQPNNVRVIPIQVEGRDEPLINANIDTSTHFPAEPSKFDGRLPRDFGSFRKQSARFQQPPTQQQQQQQQAPQNASKPEPVVPEPEKAPPQQTPFDPVAQAMARINEIQCQVQELAKQVETVQVTSRKDKQYVLLDELLTVQLLHLDNVDPEGHDNVRQARKDAIRAIQKCISVLESKVPGEPMEVDKPSEPAQPPVDEQEPMLEDNPTPTDADPATEPSLPVVDQAETPAVENTQQQEPPQQPTTDPST